MDIKLYGKNILVPTKCGTRFLMDCGLKEEGYFSLGDIHKIPYIEGAEWLVIRDPIEHFQSAIRQDVLGLINEKGCSVDSDEVKDMLKEYRVPYGAVHYYTKMYNTLYWFWRRNRHKGLKVIPITKLSELADELGFIHQYQEKDYNQQHQPNWMEKDDFAKWVMDSNPENFKDCLMDIENDIPMYEALLNRKILPIKLI